MECGHSNKQQHNKKVDVHIRARLVDQCAPETIQQQIIQLQCNQWNNVSIQQRQLQIQKSTNIIQQNNQQTFKLPITCILVTTNNIKTIDLDNEHFIKLYIFLYFV
jgi:hypothetical protein